MFHYSPLSCFRVLQGFGQHDAHEALRFILSDVHERLAVEVPLSEVLHQVGGAGSHPLVAPCPLFYLCTSLSVLVWLVWLLWRVWLVWLG